MRCKNCGWENPQSNLKCEKCNAQLTGSMVDDHRRHVQSGTAENVNLRGTVPEGHIFGSQVAGPSAIQEHSCPKCGYPIARNMKICSNCGENVLGSQLEPEPVLRNKVQVAKSTVKCSKCGCPMEIASKFCPSCGAPSRPGTINPWTSPQTGTFCTLKPLSWENECIEYTPLSYSGESIILNRANTDCNNQSITSKEQAELTYDNGSWFIEDKSELKTTYIYVGRRAKLESGDIIILGNRRFEFKG